MKMYVLKIMVLVVFPFTIYAQQEDSLDTERLSKMVSLSEVILRTDLNVPRFMDRVKKDTTFYKAFRNLHLLGFTAWNDIRINDKQGNVKASLVSKTKQNRTGNCRSMQVLNEKTSGDFYDEDGSYNYNTGELYGGLFFTKGTVCGETNIVKGMDFRPKSASGLEKRKAQFKGQ